ncbi:MAG: 1-acyl-sn-glycerol-3-phosphate acyltransferase [uncultured Sulfurovum sp.]|uniref:1-acyl-sn-glycerol-3-phosphate acyltransferase n=1 Tax=uncultured Sulfurovum sp. TaxID=269237 RepID=A0A6S6S0Y2_9BACT|nr:MAG: 1-acyl-sn-glycerol-3-phosphate acyltransferase [uncultured Sulfurovum sp.]
MKPFKTGIAHIAEAYPNVPVVPLSIYGAGKALPRGEALFVPFIIDVNVGKAIYYQGENKLKYTKNLEKAVFNLEETVN